MASRAVVLAERRVNEVQMKNGVRWCWSIALHVLGCAATPGPAVESRHGASASAEAVEEARAFPKPTDAELRQRLTPMQYEVTQHEHTEPPYHNDYWDNHEPGLYVDVVTGEPLFTSLDKYDSHTGWPSFTRPIAPPHVVKRIDHKLAYERTEIRSAAGDSHLGHVFDDGPRPTGLRYCINSAALRFIRVADLEKEGYGAYVPRFAAAN